MDNRTGWNQIARYFLWTGFMMIIVLLGLVVTALFIQTGRLGPSPTADELIVAYLGVLVRFSIGFWIVSWIAFAFLILGALIKLHKVR